MRREVDPPVRWVPRASKTRCVARTPRAGRASARCFRGPKHALKARHKPLKVLESRRDGRHGTLIGPMGKNRVFFPQAALDQWISEGKVDLAGDELTIKAEARRYRILEAARVLGECTGLADANELVGRVK